MTPETFKAGINLLTQQWPNQQVSPDVYWTVLHGMDDEVFKRAIVACLESCKFFPVIAEIREKAAAFLNASGALPPVAEEAWGQVLRIIDRDFHPDCGWMTLEANGVSRIGGGPSPLPPLLEQAVQALGGPSRVWNASHRDLGFIRQEFLDFYGHKREQEIAYGPALSQPAVRQITGGAAEGAA